MEDLSGRVGIVTGASSGIGHGIALALAAAGMHLVIAARRQDRLAALADRITAAGGVAHAVAGDVTQEADVARIFAEADALGGPDLLVNNAGIADDTPIEEMSLAQWQRVMEANVTSAFLCSRAAFGRMRVRGGGRIVNIGSIAARVPRPHSPVYSASKFALEGLTRALALEGREHLVTASILHPGATRSELVPGVTDRLEGDCLEPAHVGELVVYMARLPPQLAMVDATVIPVRMPYLGRG